MFPIPRLAGDGSRLVGKFARVSSYVHDSDGMTPSSDGARAYVFEPILDIDRRCLSEAIDCSLFDNVNAYRHVDRFAQEFWTEDIGLEIDFQVHVFTHLGSPGAWVQGDTLVLGNGGIFLRNTALEDDIIYHEYTHVVLRHLGFDTDTTSTAERRALGEGYSDYFALSYIDRADFAGWATKCPPREDCEGPEDDTEIRRLDTPASAWNWSFGSPDADLKYGVCTRKHPEDTKCKTSWMTGDNVYVWGMIWGSTLWDIRTALGREIADRLVVESVGLTDGRIFTFEAAAGAMLAADRHVHSEAHRDVLQDVFAARGIAPSHVSVGNEAASVADAADFQLEAYPNPFSDDLTLQFRVDAGDAAAAEIFDVGGRLVYRTDFGVVARGRQQFTIRPPSLAPGLYVVRVRAGERSSTRLVVRG